MTDYIVIEKSIISDRLKEIEKQQKDVVFELKKLYTSLGCNTNKYYSYKDNLSRFFTSLTIEKRILCKIIDNSKPL